MANLAASLLTPVTPVAPTSAPALISSEGGEVFGEMLAKAMSASEPAAAGEAATAFAALSPTAAPAAVPTAESGAEPGEPSHRPPEIKAVSLAVEVAGDLQSDVLTVDGAALKVSQLPVIQTISKAMAGLMETEGASAPTDTDPLAAPPAPRPISREALEQALAHYGLVTPAAAAGPSQILPFPDAVVVKPFNAVPLSADADAVDVPADKAALPDVAALPQAPAVLMPFAVAQPILTVAMTARPMPEVGTDTAVPGVPAAVSVAAVMPGSPTPRQPRAGEGVAVQIAVPGGGIPSSSDAEAAAGALPAISVAATDIGKVQPPAISAPEVALTPDAAEPPQQAEVADPVLSGTREIRQPEVKALGEGAPAAPAAALAQVSAKTEIPFPVDPVQDAQGPAVGPVIAPARDSQPDVAAAAPALPASLTMAPPKAAAPAALPSPLTAAPSTLPAQASDRPDVTPPVAANGSLPASAISGVPLLNGPTLTAKSLPADSTPVASRVVAPSATPVAQAATAMPVAEVAVRFGTMIGVEPKLALAADATDAKPVTPPGSASDRPVAVTTTTPSPQPAAMTVVPGASASTVLLPSVATTAVPVEADVAQTAAPQTQSVVASPAAPVTPELATAIQSATPVKASRRAGDPSPVAAVVEASVDETAPSAGGSAKPAAAAAVMSDGSTASLGAVTDDGTVAQQPAAMPRAEARPPAHALSGHGQPHPAPATALNAKPVAEAVTAVVAKAAEGVTAAAQRFVERLRGDRGQAADDLGAMTQTSAVPVSVHSTQQIQPAVQRETQGMPQPPVPLQQVAQEIVRQADKGMTSFEIRLNPVDLGGMDVRLDFTDNGEARAHIAVERRDTLELLSRDQRQIEKTLRDAGYDARDGSVSLSLKQGNTGDRQSSPDRSADMWRENRSASNDTTDNDRVAAPRVEAYRPRRDAVLDVRI